MAGDLGAPPKLTAGHIIFRADLYLWTKSNMSLLVCSEGKICGSGHPL